VNAANLRKWAGIFASALHERGGIPRRDAQSLGWIVAKALAKRQCSICSVNPARGGERQGAYLCDECFEAE